MRTWLPIVPIAALGLVAALAAPASASSPTVTAHDPANDVASASSYAPPSAADMEHADVTALKLALAKDTLCATFVMPHLRKSAALNYHFELGAYEWGPAPVATADWTGTHQIKPAGLATKATVSFASKHVSLCVPSKKLRQGRARVIASACVWTTSHGKYGRNYACDNAPDTFVAFSIK